MSKFNNISRYQKLVLFISFFIISNNLSAKEELKLKPTHTVELKWKARSIKAKENLKKGNLDYCSKVLENAFSSISDPRLQSNQFHRTKMGVNSTHEAIEVKIVLSDGNDFAIFSFVHLDESISPYAANNSHLPKKWDVTYGVSGKLLGVSTPKCNINLDLDNPLTLSVASSK